MIVRTGTSILRVNLVWHRLLCIITSTILAPPSCLWFQTPREIKRKHKASKIWIFNSLPDRSELNIFISPPFFFYKLLFPSLPRLPGLEKGECITSISWGKFVTHTSSTLPPNKPRTLYYRSIPALLQAGKAAYSIQVLEENPNDNRGQKEAWQRKLDEGFLAQWELSGHILLCKVDLLKTWDPSEFSF